MAYMWTNESETAKLAGPERSEKTAKHIADARLRKQLMDKVMLMRRRQSTDGNN